MRRVGDAGSAPVPESLSHCHNSTDPGTLARLLSRPDIAHSKTAGHCVVGGDVLLLQLDSNQQPFD